MVCLDAIKKFGKTPRTIYRLSVSTAPQQVEPDIDSHTKILKKQFLLITEAGEMIKDWRGLQSGCHQQKLPLEKTIAEFAIKRSMKSIMRRVLLMGQISRRKRIYIEPDSWQAETKRNSKKR